MEAPTPSSQHKWLRQLVGSWAFEGEFWMAPDQPPMKHTGTETVEALGDLWTIGRLTGETPGGGQSHSIMSIGYDPQQKRFVGTFISSMMTNMWIYNGVLDERANTLTLDTEGPSFADENQTAKYQDIIEILDENQRIFRSQLLGPDGQWVPFMKSIYRRMNN